MHPIHFDHFTLPTTPNYYLVCPKNKCPHKAHATAPIFTLSKDALITAWKKMQSTQPRLSETYHDKASSHYQYVQRSFVFRFPDYIDVKFYAIDSTHSTLAIFSRSKYGYSDMGVNKKRVSTWLAALEKIAKPAPTQP